ncbi:Arm DNA-binding domain-containing protein [Sphingopyxis fribergensis]|uniref:Arm DNA-binding domain-containing protein n=1 Tax=Sphingopyxis fribergensis TaxID=1515612 RepID=UPI00389A0F15
MNSRFAPTIANAEPRERAYKMFDGDGLHLFVRPNGSKLWRLNYSWLGKRKNAVTWTVAGPRSRGCEREAR